ncbi:TonB-dependent receptor [Fulvitalea axinellae]|uniref:TonB-dependent receptor n=1 Tax=Fulvitalea axinellae TaxID=1182444 RepID=UPI0030CA47D8
MSWSPPQATASETNAKRYSLSIEGQTLKEAFTTIRKKTGYRVFFKAKEVDAKQKVHFIFKDAPIKEIMSKLLKNTSLDYKVMKSHILVFPKAELEMAVALPQEKSRAVTGIVTGEGDEALPGVNVIIKGQTQGTTTDIHGKYHLKVKDTDVLVFSFIGYKDMEISVKNRSDISVQLEVDTEVLDEVVVIGYGVQKKVNVTGAVDVVTAKELENRPVANVQQALQGAAPGLLLQIGSGGGELDAEMGMRIRGFGSISSNGSSPYILVDGMPLENASDINKLNPNDIESVSVLKDASSTAIYGSRAAFGVILITTKSGEGSDNISVNYSNNFVFASPLLRPKMMNSLDFANYFNEAAKNSGGGAVFSDNTIELIKQHMADPEGTPGTTANSSGTGWKAYSGANANVDWFDVMYKDQVSWQQHNFSVSGKQKNTSYYLSGSYFTREGIMNFGDDESDRYTMNAKINSKVTDWLKLGANINISRSDLDVPSYDRGLYLHNIARRWPTNPVTAPNGSYYGGSEIPFLTQGGRSLTQENIYNTIVNIELTPIKHLKIKADVNYRFSSDNGNNHYAKITYLAPDNTERYLRKNNSYSAWQRKSTYLSPNVYVSYDRKFGEHSLSALAGYQQELQEYDNLSASKNGLVTDNVPSIKTATGTNFNGNDGKGHWATRGWFGRLSYNYKEKYLLESNFRYDASSRFPEDDRWAIFPSFSAGYNIAKENFWPLKAVGTFKVRGSYGGVGNQNVPNYLYIARIPVKNNNWWLNDDSRIYTQMPGLISPDLTWEDVTTANVGFDIAAFRNRLSISADFFNRNTAQMVGPAETYPAVLGIAPPRSNNAELETKGFELTFGWKDQIGELSYQATFNIGNSMTEISSYKNPQNLLNNYYEGRKIGEIWGYETHGIFQTDDEAKAWHDQSKISKHPYSAGDIGYVDQNGDGVIDWGENTLEDSGDRKIIGNSLPQYNYAFSFSANWKGLDFSMLWQGIGKRDLAIGGPYFWGASGNLWQSAGFEEHKDYWSPENTGAYYPKPYFSNSNKNQQTQTRYLQNGAYLRLKNIQLGYAVPESFTKRFGIQKLRFFLAGENLLTFTDMIDTFDPETTGGRWGAGKVYPLQKTVSMGVSIKL